MTDLIYKEEAFKIVGICMRIHQTLGMGLKEINYKDAMEIEFNENGLTYQRERKFTIKYKNKTLRSPYISDFVVFDSIIIEVKSTPSIINAHMAQTLSYLAVSGLKLALIINFGERSLSWKRIVL